jgi:hypothetical protein
VFKTLNLRAEGERNLNTRFKTLNLRAEGGREV